MTIDEADFPTPAPALELLRHDLDLADSQAERAPFVRFYPIWGATQKQRTG